MNIPEAIEVLKHRTIYGGAIQLGIEALERFKLIRELLPTLLENTHGLIDRLPSETEEQP